METAKMFDNSGTPDVAEKLRQTRDDLQQDLQEVGAAASEAAHEKIDELRAVASEYYETGRECAVQYGKNIEAKIRENPLRSLLIAAGAGIVAGLYFRRR